MEKIYSIIVFLYCLKSKGFILFAAWLQAESVQICAGQGAVTHLIIPAIWRLKQEDHKFKARCYNLATPCVDLKTKNKEG